ncbi:MAG: hypothetical protein EAZ90_12620 [Oscillatoriales cyanobacterium]|jgi:hypothetical protein|uniref:hypothetical protein n=1 Tax=Microcoleus sp. PH2017_05_CCC_O_A TaxID=2798816 RepID=UPI001DC9C9C0|nr:hypothetical protein [Microcoleus sp. PH2017_05_CCC_O_A]MCC3412416.1 hypothetical protein [Microcoleus sp. PH2017_02_FOX_O_A]TAE12886.1 MAG: hypothetical protein EAZ94_11910 [Oscillatoriales cyanobacterium]MCC3436837.1 hypothetical protein [Microcoleus sp. PH2017_05_CCC_O_A]TAE24831.1 MAG: hypothetical protein EAZ93_11695 [Oscillatoriales cyanobacterium]TAE43007.1 MAG: hypothetical protein EAZ90_12620 [Oscillatoriales cyanobacterium]
MVLGRLDHFRFAIKELGMMVKIEFFETIITAYLTAAPLWIVKTVGSECDRPARLPIALPVNN